LLQYLIYQDFIDVSAPKTLLGSHKTGPAYALDAMIAYDNDASRKRKRLNYIEADGSSGTKPIELLEDDADDVLVSSDDEDDPTLQSILEDKIRTMGDISYRDAMENLESRFGGKKSTPPKKKAAPQKKKKKANDEVLLVTVTKIILNVFIITY
jgi:hypothetical protein